MTQKAPNDTSLLSPRKIALQVLGFAVGVALLIWCINGAISKGGWDKLLEADPRLILLMLGCTLISSLINGAVFWTTIRPLKPIGFWNLQFLNVTANMLNYAPVRLGALARIAYHVRIDRLTLLQVGGWFAFIGYYVVLGVGACLMTSFLRPSFDLLWCMIAIAQIVVGTLFLYLFLGNRLLARYGGGIDRITSSHVSIWSAAGFRVLDLALYSIRMAAAMHILEIDLPSTAAITLAVVALASSLVPFGRLGFREFCVAAAAGWLSVSAADVESNMQQLALVESAAEALVVIPLGAVGLLWLRWRWKQGKGSPTPATPTEMPQTPR